MCDRDMSLRTFSQQGRLVNKQTFIDLWQPKVGLNNSHSHIESVAGDSL